MVQNQKKSRYRKERQLQITKKNNILIVNINKYTLGKSEEFLSNRLECGVEQMKLERSILEVIIQEGST